MPNVPVALVVRSTLITPWLGVPVELLIVKLFISAIAAQAELLFDLCHTLHVTSASKPAGPDVNQVRLAFIDNDIVPCVNALPILNNVFVWDAFPVWGVLGTTIEVKSLAVNVLSDKYQTPVIPAEACLFVIKVFVIGIPRFVFIGPVMQVDFIPELAGWGPIIIIWLVVADKAPSAVSPFASSIFNTKVCWPLGVLLAVCLNFPLVGSIINEGWPFAPVGLPEIIDHFNCSVFLVELVEPFFDNVSWPVKGLPVWSTVACIVGKGDSSNEGAALDKLTLKVKVKDGSKTLGSVAEVICIEKVKLSCVILLSK